MSQFDYKQRKTTDSYRKGWEKAFSKKRKEKITAPSPLPYEMKYYNRPKPKDKE